MTEITGRVGWRNFVSANNPLWDNLVSYYSADDTANDAKGTNNGTLVNGATYVAGKINGGFSFDGVNDYASFANNSWNYTGDFSLSFWMKPANTGFGYVIENFNYNGNFYGWMVASVGNIIRFEPYVGTGAGGQYLSTDAYSVNTGVWNHVAISRVGSTGTKIYINNVLRASDSNTANPVYHPTRNYSRFGAETLDGGANYYHYNGSLDEVGVWNKALTAAEVAELYNAGAGKQYVAPTPTYTARTTAFATATGITDTTILNALNTFDTGLISNGLDTKMKALYPFVGGTANTHKFNFMDARDVNAAFRLAFNGGGVHSSTGYLPNATNAYANTYLNASSILTSANNHISFYSRTNPTPINSVEMGACDNWGFYGPHIRIRLDGFYGYTNTLMYTSGDTGNYAYANSTNTDARGHFIGNILSTTNRKTYKNGNVSGTNTSNIINSLYNGSIYLGAVNVNTGAAFYTNREVAFSSIGSGLTDVEASTFYSLTQALQTALSRQV